MTGPTDGSGQPQVVVFGPRRSSMLWPMAVIYVGVVVAGLVAVASGDPKGWVLVGAGGVLTATRIGLNRMVVRRAGLRIDPAGLTWLDGNRHLAWSDVDTLVPGSPSWAPMASPGLQARVDRSRPRPSQVR